MSSKNWTVSLLSVTLFIIVLFGMVQFYLDPLLQYGNERGPLTFRTYSEIYSNPGIAKNYDYNAVLLGSSMVENTDINELNGIFDCKTIKVTYAGGSSYNHKKILDTCYNSGHKIEKVFWALDEYALRTDKETPRWPLPEYLYDDNKINDVSYLLNLDIFYYYSLIDSVETLKHNERKMMCEGVMIGDDSLYGKKQALASIEYPIEQTNTKGEKLFYSNLLDNLEYNILPFVENHPETDFEFFLVPYSILYWYQQKSNGTLEAEIFDARIAIGELLNYDNVQVHFFQNEKDIITNLDNFKDYTHFKPEINSWMLEEMKKESHLLTKETYNKVLDDFSEYLKTFDYNSFYTKQMNNLD